MMCVSCLAFLLLGLQLLLAPATAAEAVDPVELLRPLRALQDRIAQGDAEAGAAASVMLRRIGEALRRVDAEAWKKPRNVRAALAFSLSGGDPGILETILGSGVAQENERLVQGALAYARGRGGEAHELIGDISALTLDPLIAGHVALIQAELVANSNPGRAIALLDEARLLAPGTLIEEAALRRQVSLVAAAGQPERLEALSGQYLRRFPRSFYVGSFKQQFAAELVGRKAAALDTARLDAALMPLEATEQRDLYLLIATEAIARGRMQLVRHAAGKALRRADRETPQHMRALTYEAAALIVTGDFEAGFTALAAVDRAKLEGEDVELLDAALSVAEHIGQLPAASAETGPPPAGAMASAKVVAARALVAGVDTMLSRGRP
ncbi:MAG TPA: chemotaxis protein MotC [Hyphomicrobiaceae bacterium]|nr:chemotaxis protein MotC [Hyphomicrobiaceae bacterium]